jgi:hypothetical protein
LIRCCRIAQRALRFEAHYKQTNAQTLFIVENDWLDNLKQDTGAEALPGPAQLLVLGVNHRTASLVFRKDLKPCPAIQRLTKHLNE